MSVQEIFVVEPILLKCVIDERERKAVVMEPATKSLKYSAIAPLLRFGDRGHLQRYDAMLKCGLRAFERGGRNGYGFRSAHLVVCGENATVKNGAQAKMLV